MFQLLFVLLAAVFAGSSVVSARQAPTAKTLNGTYIGRHLPEFNQDLFLGVQFANAPRLDNPQPLNETWTGTRSAERYGPSCWTGYLDPKWNVPIGPLLDRVNVTIDEECLNLNIIRPAGYDGRTKLPVVVWIHGGSFTAGFGAEANTNTSYIVQASAKRDVPFIAITLNYRLGFLGFPGGYQALSAGITNLGLKDQRIALRWINENIEAFGGDPKKVTIWGQSSGAASVAHQVLAHDGQGADKLFRGAVVVSFSPYTTNALYATHPLAVGVYEQALNNTGCTDADNTLDCLRKAPVEAVWRAGATAPGQIIWPMIDGDFISEPPVYQLGKGHFSRKIRLFLGANNDEGLPVANLIGGLAQTDADVAAILKGFFPNARQSTIDEVLAAYPVDVQNPPYSLPMDAPFCEALRKVDIACGPQYRRIAAIFGDFIQGSGRRMFAEQWAAAGGTAFSYRFDTNPTALPIADNALKPGFSTHSSEYAYFFGFPTDYDMANMNPTIANVSSHIDLSKGIVASLSSFIVAHDPNRFKVPYFPKWPAYTIDKPVNMVFNATEADNKLNVHIEPDTWRQESINVWKRHPFELQLNSLFRP